MLSPLPLAIGRSPYHSKASPAHLSVMVSPTRRTYEVDAEVEVTRASEMWVIVTGWTDGGYVAHLSCPIFLGSQSKAHWKFRTT